MTALAPAPVGRRRLAVERLRARGAALLAPKPLALPLPERAALPAPRPVAVAEPPAVDLGVIVTWTAAGIDRHITWTFDRTPENMLAALEQRSALMADTIRVIAVAPRL